MNKILFTHNKGDNCFETISEFISWIKDKDISDLEIKSEIEKINETSIYNLLNFFQFYREVKGICILENEDYNKDLLDENIDEAREAILELIRMNQGGKYLRGTLAALGYRTLKDDDSYKYLATALEIFQTSILIHDDIIDNSRFRRGQKTIPVSYAEKYNKPVYSNMTFETKIQNFSNSMGICIGDLGFYLANQIIVKNYKNNPNLNELLDYYNEMVIKTCKGEMLDVELPFKEEFFETDADLENKIFEIYKLKTAWYSVIGPFCLGLILAGITKEKIRQVETALLNIGIAFQIKDDLLGIYGNEKELGKPVGSDIEENKQTILYSYTMNTSYKNELKKYYGQKVTSESLQKVRKIFEDSKAKEYAEEKMNMLFTKSETEIEEMTFIGENEKNILKGFIIYLRNRKK